MTVTAAPARKYYNYDKINSYNGVFNFLVGLRGVGKTYGAKYNAIKKALFRGEQFIYMRRYKDELKMSRDSFFSDIVAEGAFPEWDFRLSGNKAEAAHGSTRDRKQRDWKVIGYFIPLSQAQNVKSVSYPLVTTIIFDEFIIEKGNTHYLPNEPVKFQGFYSTVARLRENVKVFFLANAVSIMNPYFLEWDIRPEELPEFSLHRDGFICVHFANGEDFQQEINSTRFGKFIQGTAYGDYATKNEFADAHGGLLGKKTEDAKYYLTLETKGGTYSVWIDYKTGIYYAQEKRPKQEILGTLLPEKMNEDKMLLTYSDKLLQSLRTAFRKGQMRFTSNKARNAMTEIFKR